MFFFSVVMIINPRGSVIFSRENTFVFGFLAALLGILLSFVANFVMKCCGWVASFIPSPFEKVQENHFRFILFYKRYSYAFLGGEFNYANYYIALPLNISCSICCVACYVFVSEVSLTDFSLSELMQDYCNFSLRQK